MSCEMLIGTQHHAQMVRPPLRGAEMTPEGWGADGTYLSGGGFVRQSQDSHRTYIFEWSGARSVEEASYMQALRDGAYSKSRRDLIYFIDPVIYDKNILPKRWAQPGILAPDSGSASTPLGLVTKIEGLGLPTYPLTGAQVSSYFTSLAQFNATTEPQQGSVWIPVPPGKTLYVWAITPYDLEEGGVYIKTQNLDGSWNPPIKSMFLTPVEVTGIRGALIGTVGMFDFHAAMASFSPITAWSPGLGHSGCAFVGNPTWTATSGVNGGQVGYAATLKEVGDWQQ